MLRSDLVFQSTWRIYLTSAIFELNCPWLSLATATFNDIRSDGVADNNGSWTLKGKSLYKSQGVGRDGNVLRHIAPHKMHAGQAIPWKKQTWLSTRRWGNEQRNGETLAISRANHPLILVVLMLWMLAIPAKAALVNFSNCLDPLQFNSTPLLDTTPNSSILLQWYPVALSATFDMTAPFFNLNLTSYGNVTGQATVGTLPSQNDTGFWNGNETLGKIDDLNNVTLLRTTLFSRFNVLSYTPWKADPAPFCETLLGNTHCPIAPVFNA